jgi:hypothetical protein
MERSTFLLGHNYPVKFGVTTLCLFCCLNSSLEFYLFGFCWPSRQLLRNVQQASAPTHIFTILTSTFLSSFSYLLVFSLRCDFCPEKGNSRALLIEQTVGAAHRHNLVEVICRIVCKSSLMRAEYI